MRLMQFRQCGDQPRLLGRGRTTRRITRTGSPSWTLAGRIANAASPSSGRLIAANLRFQWSGVLIGHNQYAMPRARRSGAAVEDNTRQIVGRSSPIAAHGPPHARLATPLKLRCSSRALMPHARAADRHAIALSTIRSASKFLARTTVATPTLSIVAGSSLSRYRSGRRLAEFVDRLVGHRERTPSLAIRENRRQASVGQARRVSSVSIRASRTRVPNASAAPVTRESPAWCRNGVEQCGSTSSRLSSCRRSRQRVALPITSFRSSAHADRHIRHFSCRRSLADKVLSVMCGVRLRSRLPLFGCGELRLKKASHRVRQFVRMSQ